MPHTLARSEEQQTNLSGELVRDEERAQGQLAPIVEELVLQVAMVHEFETPKIAECVLERSPSPHVPEVPGQLLASSEGRRMAHKVFHKPQMPPTSGAAAQRGKWFPSEEDSFHA